MVRRHGISCARAFLHEVVESGKISMILDFGFFSHVLLVRTTSYLGRNIHVSSTVLSIIKHVLSNYLWNFYIVGSALC